MTRIHAQKLDRSLTSRIVVAVTLLVLVGSLVAACAPPSQQAAPATLDKVVWVSPRGSLEVMDDFNLWVGQELGYCKDLGIDLELQPGPAEALAVVKLVGEGQADAALAWRGLGPQWKAQGMDFKYLVGKELSKHPANGYAINRNDLQDPKKVDMWNRFFKCVAMGIEFARQNPRAAAQITYDKFPALREQMTPQLAFDSMWQLGCNYWRGADIGKGIGYSDLDGWNNYIDAVFNLGQIKTRPKTEDVVTNQFVEAANSFDKDKVKKDAGAFQLKDEWKNVQVPAECK